MRQRKCPYCDVYRRTDAGLAEHVETCEKDALEKDRADELKLRGGEREHIERYKQRAELPTAKVVQR